ncbi:lipase family protein [Aspergillus aculeatinus CBS 121060]|uniref:Unusual buried polar cluster in A family of fungal lipase n=1 Tax=Aspergillus aculeatinus CBS 121060 TaxID=1448322 RepID=A0ACD1H3I3_9EURO|nr:unusual buried polar cluster in A family of fungal lipase [Aspergillus aculeatinus CBS 121060]RAH68104.1 unusual buried polar cluster in A family of fungal lipase [Aspergillus aculeatinus CBS 121060]
MALLNCFLAVLSMLASLSQALPALQARDVSSHQLSEFAFWAQYADAAYCSNNYDPKSSGARIRCWDHGCPAIEATNTSIALAFSNATMTDTAGFIAVDHTHRRRIISFRGSYSVRNWLADVMFVFTDPQLCNGCLAELGFWTSWRLIRSEVIRQLEQLQNAYSDYDLVLVGYSLGAAVATLAAADLRTHGYKAALYAYASPRVGNEALAQFITNQGGNYRFTHTNDPIPKLPLLIMNYVHISPEYHILSGDNVTVRPQDVAVYEGSVNYAGNTGTGSPSLRGLSAHRWYFQLVDGCKERGFPWRRGE